MNDIKGIIVCCTIAVVCLLGIIIDQLRDINKHHRGLKIFLERWFKEFNNGY